MSILKRNINESFGDTSSTGKKWEDYDTITCPNGQVIDMGKLIDEQQRAKAALVHLLPAFGGFVGKLRHVYTFRVATQATDGYNIFINPQFTYNLDLTGKVFVMAHEIMHCVLNHLRRGRGHDPNKSNIAADHEVNITLDELGLVNINMMKKLGAYVDAKYRDKGYEYIYNDITRDTSNQSMNNQQNSNQGNQGNQGDNQQGNSGDSNNNTYSDEYKKGWNQAMEDYKKGKLKI